MTLSILGTCPGVPLAASEADRLTRRPPLRDPPKTHSCCSRMHLSHGGLPGSPLLYLQHTTSQLLYPLGQLGQSRGRRRRRAVCRRIATSQVYCRFHDRLLTVMSAMLKHELGDKEGRQHHSHLQVTCCFRCINQWVSRKSGDFDDAYNDSSSDDSANTHDKFVSHVPTSPFYVSSMSVSRHQATARCRRSFLAAVADVPNGIHHWGQLRSDGWRHPCPWQWGLMMLCFALHKGD